MLLSTQIYIIKDGRWLMLLRNKKNNDINHNKWIAVGGRKEADETIRECAVREAYEETGLTIINPDYKGRVLFEYDENEPEEIYIYTCSTTEGSLHECNEGTLAWIDEEEILNLELWEGDRVFLKKMLAHEAEVFDIILHYDGEGNLTDIRERE